MLDLELFTSGPLLPTGAAVLILFFASLVYNRYRQAFSLDGQCIVLTGAAGGLGKCISFEILERAVGVTLVLIDITFPALESVKSELEKSDHFDADSRILLYTCDVSDEDAVKSCMEEIQKAIAPKSVSVLINNAGVVSGRTLEDLTPKQVRLTFNVNVMSHFWLTKAVMPAMKKQRKGYIVSVSSVMGLVSSACLSDYCSSKAAVNGFIDSLRMEIRRDGYTNVIKTLFACPSAIQTPMFEGAFEHDAWTKNITKYLFLHLRPETVAKAMVNSIISGDERVVYCANSYRDYMFPVVVGLLKVLPISVQDALTSRLGCLDAMDSFEKSRSKLN